jgi:hypothetical protein
MTTKPAQFKTDPYFVGPVTDFLFIGGLSLLLFPLLYLLVDDAYLSTLLTAAFVVQFVINFPHFSATIFRLYHSRENMMSFPVTSFVIPVIVLAMTLAALFSVELFASVFLMIYFLWSPYHFSGQSSGVTMVYARRNNYRIDKRERIFLSGFIFSSFLISFLWALQNRYGGRNVDDITATEQIFGSSFYTLNVPDWVLIPLGIVIAISAGMFFFLIARQTIKKKEKYPPFMLFLPAIAHFVWFTFSSRFGVFAFIALVPLFHSLQYLYIAWAVQLKEKYGANEQQPLDHRKARRETLAWYVSNIIGGIIMFAVLPNIFSRVFDIPFLVSFFIIAIGFQIHHFFVDGVIWKLRNPNALAALTRRVDIAPAKDRS